MSQAPLTLTARDFDAYAPEKATSNAYSRPRLEVKQRALAWAKSVARRLEQAGIRASVHGSDEHPSIRNKKRVDCQWVFFFRSAVEREELERLLDRGRSIVDVVEDPSPYGRHAFLALRLDDKSVEVCFAVHPEAKLDLENLQARLGSAGAEGRAPTAGGGASHLAEELAEAVRALPEEFVIGVGAERAPVSTATQSSIASALERAIAHEAPLWIGWSVPRATALEHAEIMDEQLEDAIVALAPIYRLVAWSKDNDRIGLERKLEDVEAARAKAHAEAEAETARWQKEHDAAKERDRDLAKERREKPTLATLFASKNKSQAALDDGPRIARAAARSDSIESKVRASYKSNEIAKAMSAPQQKERASSSGVVEPGARVRVLRGAFVDKVGVVGELDGKGGARVMLGLLSTKLDVADLEIANDDKARPAMQTSHRRPLPTPPRKARS